MPTLSSSAAALACGGVVHRPVVAAVRTVGRGFFMLWSTRLQGKATGTAAALASGAGWLLYGRVAPGRAFRHAGIGPAACPGADAACHARTVPGGSIGSGWLATIVCAGPVGLVPGDLLTRTRSSWPGRVCCPALYVRPSLAGAVVQRVAMVLCAAASWILPEQTAVESLASALSWGRLEPSLGLRFHTPVTATASRPPGTRTPSSTRTREQGRRREQTEDRGLQRPGAP